MDYIEFANLPASEKVVLCRVEATTQFKVWQFAGIPYTFKRSVPHFIKSVKADGIFLTEAPLEDFNGPSATGYYFFDAREKMLYVRMKDDSIPKTKTIIATYLFTFATKPFILPHDLLEGEPVEWDGRVASIGNLGQQLDEENTGVVLESASSVTLENGDGFFDPIFDTLIWENKNIEFYSWSPKIPHTDAVKLFEGVIESKSFDDDKVVFKVKDFVFKLKNQVNLGLFTEADGKILDSIIGTPKRRIYGKAKQVQLIGNDNVLDGYELTGTISGTADGLALVGTGTLFLDELSPGDEIFTNLPDGTPVKVSIDSITDNLNAVLGDESDFGFSNLPAIVKPKIPWRKKNRKWHIAGHKLRNPIATILFPTSSRRYAVDSPDDFFPDDIVEINGSFPSVRRISGSNIILAQSVFPLPEIGDQFIKSPISKVYFGSKELIIDRDFDLVNTDTDSYIQLSEMAEFNISNPRSSGVALTFTNGSRVITTAATIDLRTIANPRDFIRKNSGVDANFYEILDVREQVIILRTPFLGTTQSITARVKNIEFISDDSLVTANCMGMEVDGKWMKTPSDCVKHLITYDAGFTSIDEEAFAQARADCDYILSVVIPRRIGEKAPEIKSVLTNINDSCQGSVYGNKSMAIAFSILNSRKPPLMTIIRDDDVISWDSTTEQKIVNKVKLNYCPYVDIFNGESAFETIEFQSEFVDDFIGIQNTDERTIYLFEDDKAAIMAQRIAFYKSLSNCQLTVKGKLSLAMINVNDKIYVEFDRLFKRYGGNDQRKIMTVIGVKKNGFDVELQLIDLGNIFNRVPSVAKNTTPEYSLATRDDAARYAFILDNDTLTPDNTKEDDLGNNRIG